MDINNLEKVIQRLKNDGKSMWLFTVFKMDEVLDKWSIIISAPWLTEENRIEMFNYIVGVLREYLSEKDLSSIARLGLLQKSDHLVSELLERNSKEDLKETQVNGNMIHEGHILVCDPDLEDEISKVVPIEEKKQ